MTPTPKLNLIAPLETNDLKLRIEKNSNDVYSFNNSNYNNKKMITYFKDENQKSKKKNTNNNLLTSIIESVDTVVIIGATITSVIFSVIGVCLRVVPISTGIACALSLVIN